MNLLQRARVAALQAATILLAVFPLPAVHAAPAAGCTARAIPTDSQDVTCTLAPSTIGVPLRFVAVFGGSHDDTRIQLEATLDGEPLACDERSKTSLFAEDGIVRLDCGFRVAARGTTSPPILKVALTVHHAQYVSSSLDRE